MLTGVALLTPDDRPADAIAVRGDRIVAVDGMHPIAWAESLDDLDWGAWKADDPGTHAEAVERLRNLLRRFAKEMTIVKCHGTITCDAPTTIAIASLPTTEPSIYPTCDHRPGYHLATGNPDPVTHDMQGVYHGVLADSATGEDFYGMIWNDVEIGPSYPPVSKWPPAAMMSWNAPPLTEISSTAPSNVDSRLYW